MKYIIQPRQYGKTYVLKQWFLEDPIHRVILMWNESTAEHHRQSLEVPLMEQRFELRTARRLLKANIKSWRSWRNSPRPYGKLSECEVAIDDVQEIIQYLVKGNVRWLAGTGTNTPADPAIAAMVDEFNQQYKDMFGQQVREEELGIFEDEHGEAPAADAG